ncbi:hypothetical protein ACFQX8_14805 [Klenkia terrae]|uniref:hypothetical protein n=1 Tax=Klenkia terrae TaxID=1052259 RepID=UPI00361C9307
MTEPKVLVRSRTSTRPSTGPSTVLPTAGGLLVMEASSVVPRGVLPSNRTRAGRIRL